MPKNDAPIQKENYQSYLVRMWRGSAESSWRASAQHTQSGEQYSFANIEALFLFLHEQTTETLEAEA